MDEVFTQLRVLFHITRYQLYPLIQFATGVYQIPGPPEVMPPGLTKETIFEKIKPPNLPKSVVSLDQVQDFYDLAWKTPVLLVNEPMLILSGIPNSDIRYNSFYPR